MGLLGTIVANWLTRPRPAEDTKYYFKKTFDRTNALNKCILNILRAYHDDAYVYSVCQDYEHQAIAGDVLCFRNPASWYDYSTYGRMRVRIYYDQHNGNCTVMCQKRYQLDAFLKKFGESTFNPKSDLIFIGIS
jgi:hypothetical protein